jgi:hypothetical protein
MLRLKGSQDKESLAWMLMSRGRTTGASRGRGPLGTMIHLNTYINIGIYSTKNINFTHFLLKYDDFDKK